MFFRPILRRPLRSRFFIRTLLSGAIIPLAFSLSQSRGVAQENTAFPFVIPWDDSAPTLIDLSHLNTRPAGKNGRLVARGEHFIEADTGRRVRLFGIVWTFESNFPEHSEAEKVAKRLAKYGVNAVRIHYIDSAQFSRRSIWDASKGDFQHIDPIQRERMNYLLNQFKQNGIYVNVNLMVARRFSEKDGFPASVKEIPFRFSKRVDYFNRRMIDLQKEYARDLLTHKNPYTGLTLATDPGVYTVEINNENTLQGFDNGTALLTLPEPFRGDLEARWNKWLQNRYGNTAALKGSWDGADAAPGPELITGELEFENSGKAEAQLSRENNITRVVVSKASGTRWETQLKRVGLDLQEGQRYTLAITARAEAETTVTLGFSRDHPDWRRVGLRSEVTLGPQWRNYQLGFVATEVIPQHSRLTIELGDRNRTVEIKNVSLRSGLASSLLTPEQTLERGTVALPNEAGTGRLRADWLQFLFDLEMDYAREMRDYLKKDLGVGAMVVCSQMDYGMYSGVYREAMMDYSDYHVYWDLPQSPNGKYDPVANIFENKPMTPVANAGTFARIMQFHVAGRPYSISEYNHPSPNEYDVETLPILGVLASRQDLDAVFLHEYGRYGTLGEGDATKLQSYFTVGSTPSKWAFLPAMALAFRTQLIAPAAQEVTASMPAQFIVSPAGIGNTVDKAWRGKLPPDAPFNWQSRLYLGPVKSSIKTAPETAHVALADANSDKAIFTTDTPTVKTLTGYVANRTIQVGKASFQFGQVPNNFAALTCVAWDGKPLAQSGRIILTAAARVRNTGQTWREDRKALTSWGKGPTLVDGVPVSIELPTSGPRRVWALDETGAQKQEIPATFTGGKLRFSLSPNDKAMWWAVLPR